jgi:PadR family transcriptional regulator PadR
MSDDNWLTQMRKGLLELCILNLLQQESMYGYQIVRRLTDYPGIVITEGTIYPLLSRLRGDGLVTSTLVESASGPARRTYTLTNSGQQQLRAMNVAWSQVAGAVNKLISATPGRRMS